MLSQNRLRWMAMKHDIFGTSIKNKFQKIFKNTTKNLTTFSPKNGRWTTNDSLLNPLPTKIQSERNITNNNNTDIPSRLPVPDLSASIAKFLKAVKPLVNEDEYNETEKNASEFLKADGVKLQNLLLEKSKDKDNWIFKWWLDKVYLEPRYSLIIGCNPATLYPKADYNTVDQQLEFAAKYIQGFLDYKKAIEKGSSVDKSGNCMETFYNVIGSCRVPKSSDDFKIVDSREMNVNKTNHITIMFNNRIFKLQVIDPNTGVELTLEETYSALKSLVENVTSKGLGLGVMTAADRDAWYEVYSELSKNEENYKNFESIQDSLFVLCLDGEGTRNKEIDVRSEACGQVLHGNKEFTPNRWFDKTIQVIIGRDGVWGTNFEHTVADAGAHIVLHDYVLKSISENSEKLNQVKTSQSKVDELKFEVPPVVEESIATCALVANKLIENLELFVLEFEEFGKNFPKSQKLSPDAFVQLAMQLAFYRSHEILGNAYESGSLRKFHLGRTEIIRTASSDCLEFVKTMLTSVSHIEKAHLFRKAISSHSSRTKAVMNMESFDRHLFGLKQTALENNIKLPGLYQSVGFSKLNHFYISSSQISSKYSAVTSYGPLVEDGYGCAYNIMENKLTFGISALNSCEKTSAKKFGSKLKESLLDCQNLLLNVNSKL